MPEKTMITKMFLKEIEKKMAKASEKNSLNGFSK